jgi:hypothetical protein
MSSKEITLPNGAPLVVGWNPQLATFFAQVFKAWTNEECRDELCYITPHTHRDCRGDLIEVQVGLTLEELLTLDDLERALDQNAGALTPDIRTWLEQARQANS